MAKRFHFLLLAILLLALGASLTTAQSPQRTHLPLVAHNATGDAPARIVTLVDRDTTFVAAAVIPNSCRVLLTWVDRANGNILHLTERVGDRLVEVPLPPGVGLAGEMPDDALPGLKHASGAPVIVCGRLHVYMNVRVEEGGPFIFRVLEMPVPPAQ